jgi:hemerythrin-like domain-containing protein
MMSHVSDTIRRHHQAMADRVAEQVQRIADGQPDADPVAFASFLTSELGPHADGEMRNFYPVVEPLIKAHGQATETMQVDHQFIADYIGQIDAAVQELQKAGPADRPRLTEQVRRLALKLEAVLELHFEKEERCYLPLFDAHLSEKQQQHIVDGLYEEFESD